MHAHLILRRSSSGADQILLAQKNLYLPPHGTYDYAKVARFAVQYVVPGGRCAAGEQPLECAVREFYEDTGVQIPWSTLRFVCEIADRSFYETRDHAGLELGRANAALADGHARSRKTNNLSWVSLDSALSWLGLKPESQYLPWVTEQVMRALPAGFSKELIAARASTPPAPFVEALTRIGAR